MLIHRWLIYTVLPGLIPICARFIIFVVNAKADLPFFFSEVDISVFGLIINITTINELQRELEEDKQWEYKQWTITHTGISILLIVMLALVLSLSSLNQIEGTLNSLNLKVSALVLSVASFVYSFFLYKRIETHRNLSMK